VVGLAAMIVAAQIPAFAPQASAAEVKVLLCTGDAGMWAQDRVKLIVDAVGKAAPGNAGFESDQTYNFVKKLEALGYAERFDVIVCGDVALGQMTTAAQAAIVRFVRNGGGFVYVMVAKSTLPFFGPAEVEPMPLADILPFKNPANDPAKDARADAKTLGADAPLFNGLDFSATPLMTDKRPGITFPGPMALERAYGKGRVLSLYGALGASYKYLDYAKFEKIPRGWDTWPQLGEFWRRLLDHAASGSPVREKTRQQVDGAIKTVPLTFQVEVDAAKEIDDIRAADFSVVSLSQLYTEDGGAGEDLFLALNPRDWFDHDSQKVLGGANGKSSLFAKYGIKGIVMSNNSYGSYAQWDAATWKAEIDAAVGAAKKFRSELAFFQPGNEPPASKEYCAFHNKISSAVLKEAPWLKVMGPNTAFSVGGPREAAMKEFIETCGPNTDVLNWHTYGRCPESERAEVLYWTKFATGKLRSKGPVQVMFTESDAWNSGDSQFNYLMDRAYTFLPMKEIIANFQYCMRPRFEGGTYMFGVLQPAGEFSANYNGYWIWRNLRGKMVEARVSGGSSEASRDHCHVIASAADGGKSVTAVVYYDTGYFDGNAAERTDTAKVSLHVKLPPGRYKAQQSNADWHTRTTTDLPALAEGTASADVALNHYQAAAFTWTRE
jgi:hypothetical protein